MIDTGLIAAAGKGVRAYPSSLKIPKALFEIGGKPVIQRNLEIMRDKLNIKKVYIIIGYLGWMIRERIGDGSVLGMEIRYIKCQRVSDGLAKGIYLAKDYIKSNFVLMLGDEFYIESCHEILKEFEEKDYHAVCGIKVTANINLIRKNYSVNIENDKIIALDEKPEHVANNFLGVGTYLLTPLVFDYIGKTTPSKKSYRTEFIHVIDNMARNEFKVYPAVLKGEYTNINTPEDINAARYQYRAVRLKNFKTSLIIPAYNEEFSIGYALDEFKGKVDEILVADNLSEDKTAQIARDNGARVISKKLGGYGDALKCGMDNARGDIFILMEADASFKAFDLPKIMEYLKDADMVIGTRTTKQMIEQGANMDFFLRWGNVFAAKILELLWIKEAPRFTDLGCTYRGIWKDAYLEIRDQLKAKGPAFSPEMMVEILRARKKIIEIPVTYRARIGGISKHSQSAVHILITGTKMMTLIFRKRLLIFVTLARHLFMELKRRMARKGPEQGRR